VRDDQPPDDQRKERREQREIRDERRVDRDGHPRRDAAVDDHHARDPVERAGEIDDAGQQAEPERAAERAGAEREQERRERHPRDERMTELRKAEREQDAGDDGENYRVTQGLNCSSFWSFAATASASRRVWNFPTRTR